MSFHTITINFIFFFLLIHLITSQLTIQDKNYIEKFITNGQSKTTGLFFDSSDAFKHTKQAIVSMKILDRDVRYKTEICNKVSDTKEIDSNIVAIDKLFNCKTKFKKYKPDLKTSKIIDLYHESQIIDLLELNDQWENLFKSTKKFLSNSKFSLVKEKEDKSIIATAIGVEILTLIANKKQSLKNDIKNLLDDVVKKLVNSYSSLNDDMILYIEKNVNIYRLNYHVINGLKNAKKLGVNIKGFNDMLYKLLNYFNTFKYDFVSSIDNVYYLLNIYKLLDKIPLMKVSKDSFNYLKEKNLKIKFENIFGNKLDIHNTTININTKENKQKNSKISNNKKKSSYDLDDEEPPSKNTKKKSLEIKNKENEIEFDLSEMIKEPGYYTLDIKMDNHYYNLKENLQKNIYSYSEVKIESVDFEIIDKISDSNNQHPPELKNPKKFNDIFKATQDNTLIAHVKVSFPGAKKPTLMEQVFLQLKNNELDKSYNAYASKFDKENNEYFIGFELDDPVNMESYNGLYLLTIYMSNPYLKEVLKWEFGSIKISFTKPTDPLEEKRILKNKLEPKMEPTFSPEQSRSKNQTIGVLFSGIIFGLTFLLLIVLVKSKSNVDNFPKSVFGSMMNILFIGVLGTVAYILFLFWVKYNILQTMKFFVFMAIPVCFIVYKALKNHRIEITVERDEEDLIHK